MYVVCAIFKLCDRNLSPVQLCKSDRDEWADSLHFACLSQCEWISKNFVSHSFTLIHKNRVRNVGT